MDARQLLIQPAELHAQLDDPHLRVVDCRWSLTDGSYGWSSFQRGHIPRAQFVSLDADMSGDDEVRGRHPLPSRSEFLETLCRLGIGNDSQVVAYDDGSSTYACRFWWMCRWVGHHSVRVLDGGIQAWEQANLPTELKDNSFERSDMQLREPLTKTVSADEVLKSGATLIDARTQDRFDGHNETLDFKAGHIPGAVCYPFNDNLTDEMTFIHPPTRFSEIDLDQDIVCYCGSGVSATQNIMALLLAGYQEPILYPGSWSEWIRDPSRPIA